MSSGVTTRHVLPLQEHHVDSLAPSGLVKLRIVRPALAAGRGLCHRKLESWWQLRPAAPTVRLLLTLRLSIYLAETYVLCAAQGLTSTVPLRHGRALPLSPRVLAETRLAGSSLREKPNL